MKTSSRFALVLSTLATAGLLGCAGQTRDAASAPRNAAPATRPVSPIAAVPTPPPSNQAPAAAVNDPTTREGRMAEALRNYEVKAAASPASSASSPKKAAAARPARGKTSKGGVAK